VKQKRTIEVNEEHILVIPAAVLESIGSIEGFEPDWERFLPTILSSSALSFQPRGRMEQDPSFKQLIPYVVLQWNDPSGRPHLFQYTRGGGQGERRLHAKRSVGIGGHISQEDGQADRSYHTGMQRELAEEVTIESDYSTQTVGLIYDPTTEVGRVHLGVVHRFVLTTAKVKANEADLVDARFVPIDTLLDQIDQFETWSQLTLRSLFATTSTTHDRPS
jgi:predicted NUDIX family phosphoesterase